MNDPANDTVAGWYPDPTVRFELRYHNGRTWTADVSTNGVRYVDPAGTRPNVTAPAGHRPAAHALQGNVAAGNGPAKNAPATAAMVLGIVAVAIGWLPFLFVIGAVAAVLAVVLGAIGLKRARLGASGRGFAITGVVTGGVGALVCVGGALFTVSMLKAFDRFESPAAHEAVITQCARSGDDVTARGSVTNLDTDSSSFAVRIYFVRAGTDNPRRQALVDLGRIGPGETASFEVTRAVDLADVDCIIGAVRGPLPYGIDPGT